MVWFSSYAVDKIKALVIAWNRSLDTDAAFSCKNQAHQLLWGSASLLPSGGKYVGHTHLQPCFLPVKVFLLEVLSRTMRQKDICAFGLQHLYSQWTIRIVIWRITCLIARARISWKVCFFLMFVYSHWYLFGICIFLLWENPERNTS